jgi:hypothetical protein
MATDTAWNVATSVIRKSVIGDRVGDRTRVFARAWALGQAVGLYMFAALLHSAAFLPGGDMGIIGIYLLSLGALAAGHLVTTACIKHLRDIDRKASH